MYICCNLYGIPLGKPTIIGKNALAIISFQKQQRKKLRKWPRCCWTVLPSYLGFRCPALLTTSRLTLRCTAETMKVSALSSSPPRVNRHMVVSSQMLLCLPCARIHNSLHGNAEKSHLLKAIEQDNKKMVKEHHCWTNKSIKIYCEEGFDLNSNAILDVAVLEGLLLSYFWMMRTISASPLSVNNMENLQLLGQCYEINFDEKNIFQSHHNCCGGWSHHLKEDCLSPNTCFQWFHTKSAASSRAVQLTDVACCTWVIASLP